MKTLILMLSLFLTATGFAQQYSIDWHKIAGGGGASTGATYQVIGTIGQPDAGSAMTGGNYTVTGGFWSLIAAVQTPGAPLLKITRSGTSAVVSWPSPATGWKLQQNISGLNSADWSDVTDPMQDDGTTKTLIVSLPTGTRYYRLSKP